MRRPITAVVFDMDGVLIDSEPIWQEVEARVFGVLGFELTPEMARETMGIRITEVVAHWYRLHPWSGPSPEEVAEAVVEEVIAEIRSGPGLREGATRAVDFFRSRGLRTALASSSFHRIIEAVLDAGGLRDRFEVIHSAEDEERGKPDPAVYLWTAAKLGVAPEQCLAIEDSANGVLAAKAAGMACLAIPDQGLRADERFRAADAVVGSLDEIDDRIFERTGTAPATERSGT
jgi:sugar-phosphatase